MQNFFPTQLTKLVYSNCFWDGFFLFLPLLRWRQWWRKITRENYYLLSLWFFFICFFFSSGIEWKKLYQSTKYADKMRLNSFIEPFFRYKLQKNFSSSGIKQVVKERPFALIYCLQLIQFEPRLVVDFSSKFMILIIQ